MSAPRLTRFRDIPPFTRSASYHVDYSWASLLTTLDEMRAEQGLELEPDFQRGHVWTEAQQVAFVEFMLRGGESARHIHFNSPVWHRVGAHAAGAYTAFVCVDGLQRLTAACRFLRNEIPAFGTYFRDFEDRLPREVRFTFWVNDLQTEAEVLRWYLEFNAGHPACARGARARPAPSRGGGSPLGVRPRRVRPRQDAATTARDRLAATLAALAQTLPAGAVFTYALTPDALVLDVLRLPPTAQRQGRGTRLLGAVLEAADRTGLPVTLVADPTDEPDEPGTADLLAWYARFGFVVEGTDPETGSPQLRRPAGGPPPAR